MVCLVGVKLLKKIILIMMTISIITVASSCDKFISPHAEGNEKCKELLDYLSDNDEEGLKSMFCETTSTSSSFDEQIKKAIGFFEGKATSYSTLVGTETSVDDGKITKSSIAPYIQDIKTDAGKEYEIIFHSYLVNSEHEDTVGISLLTIILDDGKECIVGEFIN